MNPVHVLLAGDRDYAPYLLEGRNKCLLEFPSGKLLDLTLAAFASAAEVRTLLVVGPELLSPNIPHRMAGKSVSFLPQEKSFSQNICTALEWVGQNHPGSSAIFVTNDAPLLTSRELDSFARMSARQDVDINVAVARISAATLGDPLVREYVRSIVALSNGLFLLANQVSLSVATVSLVSTLQEIFELRKQSRYLTSLRTLYYVLEEWGDLKVLGTWLRLVVAKKVWMLRPDSKLVKDISVSLREVESSLLRLVGQKFSLSITEVPLALGCFDADTPEQLQKLRNAILLTESEALLEAAHA